MNLREEIATALKHLPGRHRQKDHGRKIIGMLRGIGETAKSGLLTGNEAARMLQNVAASIEKNFDVGEARDSESRELIVKMKDYVNQAIGALSQGGDSPIAKFGDKASLSLILLTIEKMVGKIKLLE